VLLVVREAEAEPLLTGVKLIMVNGLAVEAVGDLAEWMLLHS
jgi:hypothetical protein